MRNHQHNSSKRVLRYSTATSDLSTLRAPGVHRTACVLNRDVRARGFTGVLEHRVRRTRRIVAFRSADYADLALVAVAAIVFSFEPVEPACGDYRLGFPLAARRMVVEAGATAIAIWYFGIASARLREVQ